MAEQMSEGRQESHKLINELKRMQGDTVNIRLLNDWMFTGVLVSVCNEIALLSQVTVISSSGLTLSTFDVDAVKINLEALTSVGKPLFLGGKVSV